MFTCVQGLESERPKEDRHEGTTLGRREATVGEKGLRVKGQNLQAGLDSEAGWGGGARADLQSEYS